MGLDQNLASQLKSIENETASELKQCSDLDALQKIKAYFLGRKKGKLTPPTKLIPSLSINERKILGPKINQTKNKLLTLFQEKEKAFASSNVKSFFDPTLPGEKPIYGHLHPITQVCYEAEDIFEKMGFEIVEPFEIDDDFHVFETLNIPQGHPARDMWDTFWTENNFIPITHTSAMQNRILKSVKPPIRAIVPGRCFRHEATDARHEHTFYQIEGVYVDQNISLADLLGTLLSFLEAFFQQKLKYKIQPSYFPFVEPGLEFLISCVICKGRGCATCGHSGWLELIPCGPIHPNVLKMGGVNPEKYSGFAWGMGLDRLVMLRFAIEDIRLFHSGNLRFLEQF